MPRPAVIVGVGVSMFGYHGRYLRVDLDRGGADMVELTPRVLRRYLGGVGLGTLLALHEGAAEADPLGAENAVVFAFSALVGSPLTTSAKFAVVSKSPLTERLNDALVSSGFALSGKACGVDAIVVRGRSDRPVVLLIDDGQVQLYSAEAWWGLPVSQLEASLKQHFGTSFRWAVIGPAGCRLVRFATVSHDGRHAGRGGTGAVLGAKRLLAIGIRGHRFCRWAFPEELGRMARQLSQRSLGPATAKYRELGTVANLVTLNRLRALPARNFQDNQWPQAERFAPEQLDAYRQVRASCAACTIGCEHIFRINGQADAPKLARIEYENLFALGPLCGIDDVAHVLEASHRCDEAGIDTISAGGTIALAMECAESRLLDAPWLRFGSSTALLSALDLLVRREGWGYWLGEGSRRLAEYLGGDAPERAMHVKGLELPGYDPRTLQTLAVGLATVARGADHNRSGGYEADLSERVDRFTLSDEHVRWAIESENAAALLDSLILCKFLRGIFDDLWDSASTMLHLVTGWDVSPQELRETVHRIISLKKIFNVRCGWQPEEDNLPRRLLEHSGTTVAQVTPEKFRHAIGLYYRLRGWNADGFPTAEQTAQLQEDLNRLAIPGA